MAKFSTLYGKKWMKPDGSSYVQFCWLASI